MDDIGGRHEEIPHNELIQRARNLVTTILDDPFLSNLSKDCTLEGVKSLLALAQGKAITVHIKRFDEQVLSVIVLQGASVSDLIQSFQRELEERCSRDGHTPHLSWHCVWQNYWLVHGQTVIEDRRAKLTSYGIGNQSLLHFTKRLKRKLYN